MSRYGHQCECAARACEGVEHVAMKYASAPSLDNAGVRRVVRTLTPSLSLALWFDPRLLSHLFYFFLAFPEGATTSTQLLYQRPRDGAFRGTTLSAAMQPKPHEVRAENVERSYVGR